MIIGDIIVGGRTRLPDRRAAIIFNFVYTAPDGAAYHFVARAGLYKDGSIGEVFVDGSKLTSTFDIQAHDAAIVLSFALQHGAKLKEISEALLRGADGTPHGMLGALCDALMKELGENGA